MRRAAFVALLVGGLGAAPLPSYRDHVLSEAWNEVDDLVTRGKTDEAIARAQAIEDALGPDGSLEYLIGLSYRLKADPGRAEVHLRRATALSPDRPDAWSDLGEILLASGRYDEAAPCWQNVTRLLPRGPNAWIGPWREAEVAAWQGRPEAFEAHLRLALERGFTFQTVEGQANWKRFYADPALHDVLDQLLTVYATPSTVKSFR